MVCTDVWATCSTIKHDPCLHTIYFGQHWRVQGLLMIVCPIEPVWGRLWLGWKCCKSSFVNRCMVSGITPSTSTGFALERAYPNFVQLKQSVFVFRNSLLLAKSSILVHSELLCWWELQYAQGMQGGGNLGSPWFGPDINNFFTSSLISLIWYHRFLGILVLWWCFR